MTGHYPNPLVAQKAITGAKVAADTLTGANINEATLGTVPSAARAGDADTARNADNAANAANANTLGGSTLANVAFHCQLGTIHAIVTVHGDSSIPSSYTPVPGYNCSGGTIEVKRRGIGQYDVRFNGTGSSIVFGTSLQPNSIAFALPYSYNNNGTFAFVLENKDFVTTDDGNIVIVAI